MINRMKALFTRRQAETDLKLDEVRKQTKRQEAELANKVAELDKLFTTRQAG